MAERKLPPAYSWWLEQLELCKEAEKLARIQHAAWVGLVREAAETCPKQLLEEIAGYAKEVGLPVKKVGTAVWLDPDCGDPILKMILVIPKDVPFSDVNEKFKKLFDVLRERNKWLHDLLRFSGIVLDWDREEIDADCIGRVIEVKGG